MKFHYKFIFLFIVILIFENVLANDRKNCTITPDTLTINTSSSPYTIPMAHINCLPLDKPEDQEALKINEHGAIYKNRYSFSCDYYNPEHRFNYLNLCADKNQHCSQQHKGYDSIYALDFNYYYPKKDEAKEKKEPVYPIMNGTVFSLVDFQAGGKNKDDNYGYGKHIILEHNVNKVNYYSLYAHLSSIDKKLLDKYKNKKPNEIINVNYTEIIGNMGNTTSYPPMPVHLHFHLTKDKGEISQGKGVISSFSVNEKGDNNCDYEKSKASKYANYVTDNNGIKEYIYKNDGKKLTNKSGNNIGDKVVIKNGDEFTKSWVVKNDSDSTWKKEDNIIVKCDYNDMFTFTDENQKSDVKVGQNYEFKVNIKVNNITTEKYRISCDFESDKYKLMIPRPYVDICSLLEEQQCLGYTVLYDDSSSFLSKECPISFTDINKVIESTNNNIVINSEVLKNAISELCSQGIINGNNSESNEVMIKPNQPINRAELSKILSISMGKIDEKCKIDKDNKFDDVTNKDQWFYKHVYHLKREGIINGYGRIDENQNCPKKPSNGKYIPNSQFCPENTLRYIESTKMILNAVFGNKLSIDDAGEEWYKGYMKCATELKLFDAGEYIDGKPLNAKSAGEKEGYQTTEAIRKNIFYSLRQAISFRKENKTLPDECKR